jgi:hypothetical protein
MRFGFVRPEVETARVQWQRIRDALAGSDAIKDGEDTYLPVPNASDASAENLMRYDAYIERAVWYGASSNTLTGLVGQAFSREATIELPTKLEPIIEDVDGCGVSLDQQLRKSLSYNLAFGRGALLSDYPTDGGKDKAPPSIALIAPWQITNWAATKIAGRTRLSLVEIEEVVEKHKADSSEVEYVDRIRVLRLKESVYVVELYDDGAKDPIVIVPLDYSGNPFAEIPIAFFGSLNNDAEIDKAPMLDIVDLNIAHYRNSADYEESVFMCGQATPVLAGLTKDWVDNVLKGELRLGSRAFVQLPVGGSALLLQAAPNGLVKEAMDQKERMMIALGARLIEQKTVQRTATEARIEASATMSILGQCAENVASAYVKALAWAGAFAGTSEPSTIVIDADAALRALSVEERKQLVTEWQSGAISFTEMRNQLRSGGVASLDDEEAKAEIDSERPKIAPMAAQQGAFPAVERTDEGAQ